MSLSDPIDTRAATDDDILQMETVINRYDQDLRSVFVDIGLIDSDDQSEKEDRDSMDYIDENDDDYAVDELLKAAISE